MRFLALIFIGVVATLNVARAQAYEGQIDGAFTGWTGTTIYKLRDGHIIQQSEYHYHYHYAYAPKILIYGSAGSYKVHVEDDDDSEDISVRFLH